MIISIAGPPGSGKSTVAKMLADKLGWKRYYMGGLRRQKAAEKGMTIQEFNKYGETHPQTDIEVDKYQEKLGEEEDNFIIEGRTSFHFIPHSLKLFLDVDLTEGAKRIMSVSLQEKSERNESVHSDVDKEIISLKKRMDSDRKRYNKYYGINDCYSHDNFDIIIDTTNMSIEQMFDEVYSVVVNRLEK